MTNRRPPSFLPRWWGRQHPPFSEKKGLDALPVTWASHFLARAAIAFPWWHRTLFFRVHVSCAIEREWGRCVSDGGSRNSFNQLAVTVIRGDILCDKNWCDSLKLVLNTSINVYFKGTRSSRLLHPLSMQSETYCCKSLMRQKIDVLLIVRTRLTLSMVYKAS